MSDILPCPLCGSTDLMHGTANKEPAVACCECTCRALQSHWQSRAPAPQASEPGWQDDPSADERWNAGLDFGQQQLCKYLGVDPDDVTWDAATEELEGDVQAVIGNIMRTKFGDDWSPSDGAIYAAVSRASVTDAEHGDMMRAVDAKLGDLAAPPVCSAAISANPFDGLAERLDRVLVTARDGERFILSAESAKNIAKTAETWVQSHAIIATDPAAPTTSPEPDAVREALGSFLSVLRGSSSMIQDGIELHVTRDMYTKARQAYAASGHAALARNQGKGGGPQS